MRTPSAVLMAVVLALSIVPMAASRAATSDGGGPHTWDGTCQLKGVLHFDEPIGNQLRPTTFTDQASGTCSGTLDGKPITNLPTSNNVNGLGVLSCAGGHALSSDFLDFGQGRKLHIASDSFAVASANRSFSASRSAPRSERRRSRCAGRSTGPVLQRIPWQPCCEKPGAAG